MSRTYSDPAYGAKQTLPLPATGSLAGTQASSTEVAATRVTIMQPITVTDLNWKFVAGGTGAGVKSVILNKSAAGTGAAAAIGTLTIGTHATGVVVDDTVTETNLDSGDDLFVSYIGTAATVENVQAYVQYKEHFVESDS